MHIAWACEDVEKRLEMKRAAMTAVVVDKEEMEDGNNNLPSFIGKLSLMLKDKTSTRFVKWSQGGSSFTVLDPPTFAAQVLPRCARCLSHPSACSAHALIA